MHKLTAVLRILATLSIFFLGGIVVFQYLGTSSQVVPTPEERAWLNQHPDALTPSYDADSPNFGYVSPQGELIGLSAEVVALIENRFGIRFHRCPSADWFQHLAALEKGTHAVAPTVVQMDDRKRYIDFILPYAIVPAAIIALNTVSREPTLDRLAEQRVTAASRCVEEYVCARDQDRFTVIPVHPVCEGLHHVAFGQADALIENLTAAVSFLPKEDSPNLWAAGGTDYAFVWRIGIRRYYPLLARSTIQFATIPEQELEALRRRWIAPDGSIKTAAYWLQWGGLFAVLLVLGLAGMAGSLKRQLDEKIVALRRTHEELRQSEEQYRMLIHNLNTGIYRNTLDSRGRFLQANPALVQMFGYATEADFLQTCAADLHVNPEEREYFLQEILAKGQVTNRVLHLRRRDGRTFWGAVSAQVAYDEHGRPQWIDGVLEDVTARREEETRQRLVAAVFDAAHEAILVTDAAWKIVAVNPAFTTLTGYTEAEALGRTPRWLWAERHPRTYFIAIGQAVVQEGLWQGECRIRCKNRHHRVALVSLTTVRDHTRQITHYVSVATDITALKEAEQRIEHLAFFDDLTGLPNRVLLRQRAELALAMAWRRALTTAVLFLDLDRFKEVNDSLGHAEGDALLIQVAHRLRTLIRDEDTISRLGGDEFVLLLVEADHQGALRVANRILAVFRQPFLVAGHSLQVTVSIGIALYPHDGGTFEELLKNADTALYRAKQDGRNTRVFYDRAMNAVTFERLLLDTELRQALLTGQLRVYFQPKVHLANGILVGGEALVRWEHPERGLVAPGQFIPVAEAGDLIIEIGDWMLTAVCRQLAEWRRQGLPLLPVAVNLAARHFRLPGLVDRIRGLLTAYDLPPAVLELELTESTLLEADTQVTDTLQQLRRMGIALALDDFGTGYSSLSYLKRLPLTTLKIDRSFVRDLVDDLDDRMLAATIVTLGRQMELIVVAEGVETEEQRRLLQQQGCDLAQGYLFSPPLSAEHFAKNWLQPARNNAHSSSFTTSSCFFHDRSPHSTS